MEKKLEIVPRYFGELWAFLKSQRLHLESLQHPENGDPYAPWAAFVTGIAIFLSILALDAAQSVRQFDRIVFFTLVVGHAVIFFALLHFLSRCLGGKATWRQAVGGGEYVIGFLLPSAALVGFGLVSLLNLFPGMNCSLGNFRLASMVPTVFNQALVTLAIGTMLAVAGYGAYRTLAFFKELEQLGTGKTVAAMVLAAVPMILLHQWLEFMAIYSGGELRKIAGILGGAAD